jgi:hypothetical protein
MGIDWLIDEPAFTSYKDFDAIFGSSSMSNDGAAVSTSAILVSSGDIHAKARPAEVLSLVLKALGDNPKTKQSLRRFYYCGSKDDKFQKIFTALGIKSV